MNERIKELMAQAGFDPAAIERMGVMPQAEKFVELIVRECAHRLEEDYIPEEEIIEGYNDDCDNTLRYAVTTIKEHFDIKG